MMSTLLEELTGLHSQRLGTPSAILGQRRQDRSAHDEEQRNETDHEHGQTDQHGVELHGAQRTGGRP